MQENASPRSEDHLVITAAIHGSNRWATSACLYDQRGDPRDAAAARPCQVRRVPRDFSTVRARRFPPRRAPACVWREVTQAVLGRDEEAVEQIRPRRAEHLRKGTGHGALGAQVRSDGSSSSSCAQSSSGQTCVDAIRDAPSNCIRGLVWCLVLCQGINRSLNQFHGLRVLLIRDVRAFEKRADRRRRQRHVDPRQGEHCRRVRRVARTFVEGTCTRRSHPISRTFLTRVYLRCWRRRTRSGAGP